MLPHNTVLCVAGVTNMSQEPVGEASEHAVLAATPCVIKPYKGLRLLPHDSCIATSDNIRESREKLSRSLCRGRGNCASLTIEARED